MVQHDGISKNLKELERTMDGYGNYNPYNFNVYNGLKRSVQRSMFESIRKIPLHEFLAQSGKSTAQNADYLVPVKLHDILINASQPFDIVPLISMMVVDFPKSGSLTVDIAVHDSMKAREMSSGGSIAPGTVETVQATITPKFLGWNVAIDNSLIEDSNFDLVEWHYRNAGMAFSRKANELALTVLLTATDGDGTLNSSATGDADETKFTSGTTSDVVTAIRKLGDDEFVPDTLVCTSEAWGHSIMMHQGSAMMDNPPVQGFNNKISILDVLINNNDSLHAATDAAGAALTNCISLIFDRKSALLTGRKRWLTINNYSDPVYDIAGAVIVGEQDSVTVYDDAIYKLTET